MMLESKPWWASKTIWGGVAAAVAGLASTVGIEISGEEVSALGDSLLNIVTVIGGIFAVYGRIRAERTIK